MSLALILQTFLTGLAIGGVYALFALGYTLIFSILRIINFAHAAVFAVGAYLTYALTGSRFGFNGILANSALPFGLPFPLALLVGAVLAGLVGVVVERLFFAPLRARKADPLLTLVSSLGVSVALVNLIQFLVGAENYSYPSNPFGQLPSAINFGTADFPIPIRTIQIVIFAVSMVLVLLLTLLINYTKVGKALQAISEDEVTSSLLGINAGQMIVFTFFLSSFLGGVAGTLVGLSVSIARPSFGIDFGLKGLSVIILGGLGDIPGAVVGGLVLGLTEAFAGMILSVLAAQQVIPPEFNGLRDAIAFALLFVVLLVRPQGLLGRATVQKV